MSLTSVYCKATLSPGSFPTHPLEREQESTRGPWERGCTPEIAFWAKAPQISLRKHQTEHFAMPPLALFSWKFASTNQKQFPDLGSDAWSASMELISALVPQTSLGKPVVESQNVGSFLILCQNKLFSFSKMFGPAVWQMVLSFDKCP